MNRAFGCEATAAALTRSLQGLAGGRGHVVLHSERPWRSITFSGSRHRIALTFLGTEAAARGEAFVAALPEHEFNLPRVLVADVEIVGVERTSEPRPQIDVEIDVLIIEQE
ncbi:MAG: hypothetical protein ABW194_11540 [Novosphingobium sp.]